MPTDPLELSIQAGYEERDVRTPRVFYFLLVIAVVLILTALGVKWFFGHLERTSRASAPLATPFETDRPLPPTPRLQSDPEADVTSYRNSQRSTLNTYGWVNHAQGVVRIPIDRAMQLTLERGLPTRSGTTGNPEGPPSRPNHANSRAAVSGVEAKR